MEEKRKVTNNLSKVMKSDYKSFENQELVKNKDSINQNIETQNFRVVDARSKERFEGKVPEPREGLKSGNIKNSVCIPFGSCLNQDRTFRNKQELEKNKIFDSYWIQNFNLSQQIPLDKESVDYCLMVAAWQYLQYPENLTKEIARILSRNGKIIIAFSNRAFWHKAPKIWT